MQFTLSSLLISFVIAGAALAAFGLHGGLVAAAVLVGAVAIVRNSIRPWHTGAKVGCVLLIGLCGLSGVLAVSDPREVVHRMMCHRNLEEIAGALQTYHEVYGVYPPAYIKGPDGKPWHSWRVLILPYMDYSDLYKRYRFEEPWNGPNNQKLAGELPGYFICGTKYKWPNTNYLAVIGPQAAWLGETSRKADDFCNLASTIQLVEVPDSGISWLEPRDLTMDEVLKAKDAEGYPLILIAHSGHLGNVGMADGSFQTLPCVLSTDTLAGLLAIDADKTGLLNAAAKERSAMAAKEGRIFLIKLSILVVSTLVLLLRPNPRWKKPPLPGEEPAAAVE